MAEETRKDFKKITYKEAERIIKKVETTLSVNPYAVNALKGQFIGLYRCRIGDYRVIYEILDQEVTVIVLKVGHWKDVYD